MKLWVALLGAALLAGCRAEQGPEEPRAGWEAAVDSFWEYVAQLGQAVENGTARVKSSEIGRQLDGLIAETMEELEAQVAELQAKLGPSGEAGAGLRRDVEELGGRLRAELVEARGRAAQYGAEARAVLQQGAEDLRSRLAAYARKLRKRLAKDAEELRSRLAAAAGEVRARAAALHEGLPVLRAPPRLAALGQALGEQGRRVQRGLREAVQELWASVDGVLQGLLGWLTMLLPSSPALRDAPKP
ncbi:apolipoprotein E [Dromaius novaehollandiae]|uniref:apolipoprotein E n=1 Tax=Dromaius novaehollandiae TaxID=8790 RepID=UPI00311F7C34